MTAPTLHPLAADYLKRLRDAARSLPRGRRDDLLADIESHLAESAPAGASEADVRTALDRLGDPDDIVAAEQEGEPQRRRGALEWGAIILLLVGGVVMPLIGWIVGVLLLWISQVWTTREKLIGTLAVPGGLLPGVVLFLRASLNAEEFCRTGPNGTICTGGPSTAHVVLTSSILLAFLVIPFVTAVYLARRAQPAG
jgi:hypothetical protein